LMSINMPNPFGKAFSYDTFLQYLRSPGLDALRGRPTEGFDVNNICVIVPLRASNAPILLEQTIGRGLRLMWREPEYASIKLEDRKRVLVLHKEPKTYIDMLSIIEHPAFIKFDNELIEGGLGRR